MTAGASICSRLIGSAPLDGTQILVWSDRHGVDQGPGYGGGLRLREERFALVRWFQFGAAAGYWSTHHKGQGRLKFQPTHWCPLHFEERPAARES